MRHRATTTILSVLAVAAMAASAGQAVTLKRVPKVGEKATFKMKIDVNVQGMAINVSFDVIDTISKVNEDGSYVMTEVNTNQLVTMDGQILEEGGEDEVATYTYNPDGSISKIVADQMMGGEHYIANLTTIMWPKEKVDTGSKWTAKIPANKEGETPEITLNYEILGREKVAGKDTFKIKMTAKGGDASNDATAWVEIGTGLTIKAQGQMKSVPIQGMMMDPVYSLEIKA